MDPPKTVAQLSDEAGIVPSSVRTHLRRLERAGLVRPTREPGAEPMWEQARELDPATRYRIVGRVQRGRLVEPRDALAPEHERPRRWWWPRGR
ncbi:transcriptional regulator [Nocardioides aromaticivorans]|uniref:transcriptional regulator n=1 Tax=Nocardioides aromaticivorans TaxID=200618 RepID=UPI0015CDDE18|nr:winged helix-turn-helix domain-containing protein [Nocardioides aromaticivorans]